MAPACQPASAPATATAIPDDKMARILADLNIAEAATARLNGYLKYGPNITNNGLLR